MRGKRVLQRPLARARGERKIRERVPLLRVRVTRAGDWNARRSTPYARARLPIDGHQMTPQKKMQTFFHPVTARDSSTARCNRATSTTLAREAPRQGRMETSSTTPRGTARKSVRRDSAKRHDPRHPAPRKGQLNSDGVCRCGNAAARARRPGTRRLARRAEHPQGLHERHLRKRYTEGVRVRAEGPVIPLGQGQPTKSVPFGAHVRGATLSWDRPPQEPLRHGMEHPGIMDLCSSA